MTTDKLYKLAFEYKAAKLWKTLSDIQVFAVKLSDERIGYISIMGAVGDHCALGLYIGDEGFNSFRVMAEVDPTQMTMLELQEHLLRQMCLQCAFEGKDQVPHDQREEAKAYARAHGIRIGGRNAYPHFFKCRPNRYPWHLQTEQEAEDLCEALSAALEVARLLEKETPGELGLWELDKDTEEVPMLERQKQSWELGKALLPGKKPIEVPSPKAANQIAVANLKKIKKSGIWECEIIRCPQPVQNEPVEAPVFPIIFMAVESSTDYVLHVPPVEDYEEHPEKLLNLLIDALLKEEIRPIKVKVRDERSYQFVKDLCGKLKVPISMEENLMALDSAENDFMMRFGMDGGFGLEEKLDDLNMMLDEMLGMGDAQLGKIPPELSDFFNILKEQGALPEEIQDKVDRVFRLEEPPLSKKRSLRGRKKKSGPAQSYIISASLGAGCYRHIQISSDCTLLELHSAILGAFDFDDFFGGHAHAFFMDNVIWSDMDSYYVPGMDTKDRTTDQYTLEQAGLCSGKKFKYLYDFGDEWTFQCKVLRTEEGSTPVPAVIRRKGKAPDQDGYW